MENIDKERKKIPHKKKNVFVGRNPITGTPYFEEKKVPALPAEELDAVQPTIEELPPVLEDSASNEGVKLTKFKPGKDQDPLA